jgi:hypothetical protein
MFNVHRFSDRQESMKQNHYGANVSMNAGVAHPPLCGIYHPEELKAKYHSCGHFNIAPVDVPVRSRYLFFCDIIRERARLNPPAAAAI